MQSAFALSPSVAGLAVPCFSTLSDKRHDFRGKKLRIQNACLDFLYGFGQKHFSFSEEFIVNIIINIIRSSCKVLVILVRFLMKLKYLDRFSKSNLNFMKIRPVGAELLNADGDTNLMNPVVSLLKFCEDAKSELLV